MNTSFDQAMRAMVSRKVWRANATVALLAFVVVGAGLGAGFGVASTAGAAEGDPPPAAIETPSTEPGQGEVTPDTTPQETGQTNPTSPNDTSTTIEAPAEAGSAVTQADTTASEAQQSAEPTSAQQASTRQASTRQASTQPASTQPASTQRTSAASSSPTTGADDGDVRDASGSAVIAQVEDEPQSLTGQIEVSETSTETVENPSEGRIDRLVNTIIGLLVVVGLLIMLLTWRYWVYTNPRGGLSPSRAKLAKPRRQPAGAARPKKPVAPEEPFDGAEVFGDVRPKGVATAEARRDVAGTGEATKAAARPDELDITEPGGVPAVRPVSAGSDRPGTG